jgi:hypothetical protein
VYELNNKIKENLTEEKIRHFFEVIDTINNVINKKEIYFKD